MANVWEKGDSLSQALDLPVGRYYADFGFLVEQSVEPHQLQEAVEAVNKSDQDGSFVSQSQTLVFAQEKGLAFDSWAPIRLM